MKSIQALASDKNLYLIEDCSQAHGAKIDNKSVGSFSDISTWSFCTDKIISTGGEGGMITTSNNQLKNIITSFKNHGKNQEKLNSFKKEDYLYKWIHDSVGLNFRLTELQSAIGLMQLKKINYWNLVRSNNASKLTEYLKNIPIVRLPKIPKNFKHAWYKFYFYIKNEKLLSGWSRDRIINEINLMGFPAFQGSCSELYLEDCFKSNNILPLTRLANARLLGETSIMLLVHPTILENQMENYASAVQSVLLRASK